MTDALQLVEGRIRQRPTFPANLQPPIRKVIDLDHFAAKANCQAFRLKRQLHATVTIIRERVSVSKEPAPNAKRYNRFSRWWNYDEGPVRTLHPSTSRAGR